MTTSFSRLTTQTYARLGGFLYLLVISVYMVGSFLAGSFHVDGDLGASATAIAGGETAYRASLALQLLSSVLTVLLGGAFYAFLRQVDESLALFALLWRVCEAVLGGVTAIFLFAALKVYLAFPETPAAESVLLALRGGSGASFLASIVYFGVGSTLFFLLLWKSRFIPSSLSLFGLGASILAWIMAVATLIAPTIVEPFWFLWAPIFLAEVAAGLWLCVRGIRTQ